LQRVDDLWNCHADNAGAVVGYSRLISPAAQSLSGFGALTEGSGHLLFQDDGKREDAQTLACGVSAPACKSLCASAEEVGIFQCLQELLQNGFYRRRAG
jgi:hypothetical protein